MGFQAHEIIESYPIYKPKNCKVQFLEVLSIIKCNNGLDNCVCFFYNQKVDYFVLLNSCIEYSLHLSQTRKRFMPGLFLITVYLIVLQQRMIAADIITFYFSLMLK